MGQALVNEDDDRRFCQRFLGNSLKFISKLGSDELYWVTKISRILLISSFICSFFFLSNENFNFFSVEDFSATTLLRIPKFGTKLDSDELYCVAKTATYCLSIPLFVHFSFSPIEISVTDVLTSIGPSVFKFCVHLQVGKVYCVNGN